MAYTYENGKNPLKPEWVQNGFSSEANEWVKSFGEDLTKSSGGRKALTTGQLRKFFGKVKQIDVDFSNKKSEIATLEYLLVYSVGRDKSKDKTTGKLVNKTKIMDLSDQLKIAIDFLNKNITNKDIQIYYKNFVKIFEAIVAYHKFYGGQESANN